MQDRIPSLKTLKRFFPRDDEARVVRKWLEEWRDAHVGWMHALKKINEGIGAHGVEGARDEDDRYVSYVNTGDTYNATVLYDEFHKTMHVTTLGDFIEAAERRGRRFP
jgi:cytochrome oxidase Cu insertion factor (SCO1/SenC/PrrC family)